MQPILPGLLTGSLLLSPAMAGESGPSTGVVAKDVPLGHKDFYPSTERPIGYRGDGTGLFPGAKGVALEWDRRTGKNIIWKCRLPYWGNSPVLIKNTLYYHDHRAKAGGQGEYGYGIVAVEKDTGKGIWRRPRDKSDIDHHIHNTTNGFSGSGCRGTYVFRK